jgi:two-component system sensor histidine kinase RegB
MPPLAAAAAAPMRTIPDRNRLNFSWLMKLRWSSVAGQLATILGVYWILGIDVPLLPLLSIVTVEFLSNTLSVLWFRRQPAVQEWHLAGVMALDVLLLTGLLYFTGGATNPFSFLYLVNIALAAVVLHAEWTWALVALSLVCFGLLLLDHWPLPVAHLSPGQYLDVQQRGMWVAFGVAAAFIVHFLLRVIAALSARERELDEARQAAARQERLASLATMAAGAAHELSTPLGTIAVVAKELEHQLRRRQDPGMLEDARLIREQVARCRGILDQMGGGVGKSSGDTMVSLTVRALLDEALAGVRPRPPVVHEVEPASLARRVLRLPPAAVAQALRSVLTNAQDATTGDEPVSLRVWQDGDELCFEVVDRGTGMAPEVQQRAGEPFFTTKAPGRGMGLGLFLCRAVVERLGGALEIQTALGEGTRVRFIVPLAGVSPPEEDVAASGD